MATRVPSAAIVTVVCLGYLIAPGVCFYRLCNRTWTGMTLHTTTNLELPPPENSMLGQPFYCWFKFYTSPGLSVDVSVQKINAGYYEKNSKSCQWGYLAIHDGDGEGQPSWPDPTFICGTDDNLDVRKVTLRSASLIEFRSVSLQRDTSFKAKVHVMRKVNDTSSFGALLDSHGKKPNTNCEWNIQVDECNRHCKLYSPGYPGVYPANTRCEYTITNKDKRMELAFGKDSMAGKFDIMQSDNCAADRLSIYDGPSSTSRLVGRFCGTEVPLIISRTSTVFMVFESGPGAPNWDYKGFNIRLTERWPDTHDGGRRIQNSQCGWTFTSTGLGKGKGDTHTPDYYLPPNTSCDYIFTVAADEELEVVLKINSLLPNCKEYVQVFEGVVLKDTICADRLKRGARATVFKFNGTGSSELTVRYHNKVGQISNEKLVWMIYIYTSKLFNDRMTNSGVDGKKTTKNVPDGYNVVTSSPGETSGVSHIVNDFAVLLMGLLLTIANV